MFIRILEPNPYDTDNTFLVIPSLTEEEFNKFRKAWQDRNRGLIPAAHIDTIEKGFPKYVNPNWWQRIMNRLFGG